MQLVEMKERSLSSLFSIIESQPGDYRHLSRGQTNAEWSLTPSLYRIKHLGIAGGTLESSYDLFEANWVVDLPGFSGEAFTL